MDLLAACSPGLEALTIQELHGLGLRGTLSGHGSVAFQGTQEDLYRANLHLRTADRISIRLDAFHAVGFPELRRKAALLPWEEYLSPGRPILIRAECKKSRLYHEGGVAQRIAEAAADRLRRPPLVQKAYEDSGQGLPQLIFARFDHDRCSIEIDSSGEFLHKRGYRLETAKAPLRETLACAMILASGWDRKSPFLDPFCGSGTLPIEAALMAADIPPGHARRFSFMDWPGYRPKKWEALLAQARKDAPPKMPRIMASDRDAGAIRAAQANAERAGAAALIEFSCKSVSSIEPPHAPGCVVTNPPYGMRLKEAASLRDLYAQLGHVLRRQCPGWSVTLLSSTIPLINSTGLPFGQGMPTMNGGLSVRLVRTRSGII